MKKKIEGNIGKWEKRMMEREFFLEPTLIEEKYVCVCARTCSDMK